MRDYDKSNRKEFAKIRLKRRDYVKDYIKEYERRNIERK